METEKNPAGGMASVRGQYRTEPYGAAGTILQKSNPVTVHVLRVKATKTVTPACARRGEQVTYTIVVSNESDLPIGNVQVFDPDAALWFEISNLALNGMPLTDCILTSGVPVGALPPGGRAAVTFDAMPRKTAPEAPMSAAEVTYEYDLQDRGRTGRTQSNPAELMMIQPGLFVRKTADRMATMPDGPPVKYQIQVENTGNVSLEQVTVTDVLPLQMEYIPGSLCINGRSVEEPVSLPKGVGLGTLAPGQLTELQFSAKAKG